MLFGWFAAVVGLFIGWQLANGVPLSQSLRPFADNSYELYALNATKRPVTLVGVVQDPMSLSPGQTVKVADVQDESIDFPVRVVSADHSKTNCFPTPFYEGAYPAERVVVRMSSTAPGRC